MTVLEAADAMERSSGTRLIVRDLGRIVGVLTEEDIVRKVLNAGRRPDTVYVREVMQLPPVDLLSHAEARSTFAAELEPVSTYKGRCQECGLYSLELEPIHGRLECPSCASR